MHVINYSHLPKLLSVLLWWKLVLKRKLFECDACCKEMINRVGIEANWFDLKSWNKMKYFYNCINWAIQKFKSYSLKNKENYALHSYKLIYVHPIHISFFARMNMSKILKINPYFPELTYIFSSNTEWIFDWLNSPQNTSPLEF